MPSDRVRIKVCGLTREQDVAACLNAGVDMLGFIHVPKSPRYVDEGRLKTLLAMAKDQAETVVVVQNADMAHLAHLRASLDFDWFQGHGDEDRETLMHLRGYKVLHVEGQVVHGSEAREAAPFYLLDTAKAGVRGGTGMCFNWQVLSLQPGRFLVAGGLSPENVGQLVREHRPWGVDVSSGVESSPGIKDHARLRQFVTAVRSNT